MTTVKNCIGLMSGTSMDGIDAVLLETDGQFEIKQRGSVSIPYESIFQLLLKAAEYAVKAHKGNLKIAEDNFPELLREFLQKVAKISDVEDAVRELQEYIHGDAAEELFLEDIIGFSTMLHAVAIEELIENLEDPITKVDLVGYHGQALYHNPAIGVSVQVGDSQLLADDVGLPVISDFRINDIRNGGQGAPLAPIYHQALAIRGANYPIAIVNCGGIANITIITGLGEYDTYGYDTGPGNTLIDRYVRLRTENKEQMDFDGKYGTKGVVNEQVLKLLEQKSMTGVDSNYFEKQPPKSLDTGNFQLIPELDALSLEDACATLAEFSAKAIVDSLSLLKVTMPNKFLVAGGGWKNPAILNSFTKRLKDKLGDSVEVKSADAEGYDSTYMEAELIAYLAVRSLHGLPISLPNVTGCKSPTLGGKMFKPTKA